MMKMIFEAAIKLILGIVLVGAMIFVSAGKMFFQGLLFMGVLFAPMIIVGTVMIFKDPELLRKRLNAGEKRKTQSVVVKISGLMFVLGFVLAGFNVRFSWYMLPWWASVSGTVLFLLAYILYAEVMRENQYLSRTIQVQEGQKVVDTGLYRIVRHPMYSVTVIMFLMIPVILGSVFALLVFLVYPVIIAIRIKNEEQLLEEELEGYKEYKNKVRYRLIPFIW